MEHGYCNDLRDENPFDGINDRIDFGSCGQAYETLDNGETVPARKVGFGVFLKEKDVSVRVKLMAMLADIYNAMQRCHDQLEAEYFGNSLPYGNEARTAMYGMSLRDGLGCQVARFELGSVQVKIFPFGVKRHRDKHNCVWFGYTKTGALCVFILDKLSNVVSLKFIANSRKRAGEYFDKSLTLRPLKSMMLKHVTAIQRAYRNFCSQYKGPHGPPQDLDHRHPENMILDDHCPYEKKPLDKAGKIIMERLELPTSCIRDLWLSMGITVLFTLRDALGIRKTVQLAIMASYQTGFHRFFYLGSEYEQELTEPSADPALVYFQLANKLFGTATGDVGVTPRRLNPSGYDFVDIYCKEPSVAAGKRKSGVAIQARCTGKRSKLSSFQSTLHDVILEPNSNFEDIVGVSDKEDEVSVTDSAGEDSPKVPEVLQLSGVMHLLVGVIVDLLKWIDQHTGTNDFHHAMLEHQFRLTLQKFPPGTDIKEFRLMIIIQMLIGSGIIVRPHSDLRHLVYPVKDLGAAKQLAHLSPEERVSCAKSLMTEHGIEHHGGSGRECVLCDWCAPNRVEGIIKEHFARGQHLFMLIGDDATPSVKLYNSRQWEPIPIMVEE